MRIRHAAISVLVALTAGLVLALPSTAAAAKPCWERVIDDWLANGRITGTYKASCYQQALKHVPEDLRDYSNITDAIAAAMQNALRPNGTGSNSNGPSTGSTQAEKNRTLQGAPRSYYRRAIDNLGTTSADSLPIPLLVLASLGGLLLLTAAGLAARKRLRTVRAARGPTPPDDS